MSNENITVGKTDFMYLKGEPVIRSAIPAANKTSEKNLLHGTDKQVEGFVHDFVTMKEVVYQYGKVARIIYRDVEEIKALLSDSSVLRHLAALEAVRG